MTDLPETIPPGKYVLVKDEDGDEALIEFYTAMSPPMLVDRSDEFGVFLTEAQARHLLAMPGRPHDDRLGGGALPCWCPPDECWLPTGTTRIAGGCRAGRAGEAPDATPGTAAPHGDRLDGPGCGGGSDAEHCSCWLNEEKPCCRCRYDGDEAITCAAPDPTRAHWTEAQRQPGQERGMRRPDADGGGWYGAPSGGGNALVMLKMDDHDRRNGIYVSGEPHFIAPDGTVPVAPKEQA